MIQIKKLISSEIDFLNKDNYLYSIDFRVLSEDLNYKIPAMWKYENLIPWIVSDKLVVVNEDANLLSYSKENIMLLAKKEDDPRISVYKRLSNIRNRVKKITALWTAVPHPDADEYCKRNGLNVLNSYSNFLISNNKETQKKLLKKMTPDWGLIESRKHLNTIIASKEKYFIKRIQGSGGFTAFRVQDIDEKFYALFDSSPDEWFFEKEIEGTSYSVQCVKEESGKISIFGFSEQIIENGRFYSGSKILSLQELDESVCASLKKAIKSINDLLVEYIGFFGLDFIIGRDKQISILEANIRLTAVTIPTLIKNSISDENAIYREEVKEKNLVKGGIKIAIGDDALVDELVIENF